MLLTIALLGCGGDSGPNDPVVDGAWSGIVRNNEGAAIGELSLTLNESVGDVSGAGSLGNAGDAFAVTAEGTYAPPDLTLTLNSDNFEDVNLSAEVNESSIVGTLNGSGFINSDITMNRP